ncbi:MAG: DUF2142 domain-containing protein [Acidobacteriota bacterium]|nr:DUF2142 domain-containing protein [Acidobacteriota bacterium]
MTVGRDDRPGRAAAWVCFVWAFVGVGLAVASWSIATPLMASPDEPAQSIQAGAAVRGQIDEPLVAGPVGRWSKVTVPRYLLSAGSVPTCFSFKSNVSAGCAPSVSDSDTPAEAVTQFSNYPPLYFLVVGLPTLAMHGARAVYAMRMAGALLDAALLALGLFVLARYYPRRRILAGALLALSPMVFFITGMVGDSGMEIAAAFAAWAACLCVVRREDVPRPLCVATALSLVLFTLSRPTSPAYVAIALVVLAVLAGWRRVRDLLGARSTKAVAVALAGAFGVAFVMVGVGGLPSLLGGPTTPPLTHLQEVQKTFSLTWSHLHQAIGNFGWTDTPVPWGVTVVWAAGVGAVIVAGAVCSGRIGAALAVLVVAVVALPVVLESPRINAVGPYWQGRYWLPLLVGLPLVALAFERRRPSRAAGTGRRVLGVVGAVAGAGLLVAAQLGGFLTALHRYETGLGVGPRARAQWGPPGGAGLMVVLFAVGYGLVVLFALVYGGVLVRQASPVGRSAPAVSSGPAVSPAPSGGGRDGDQLVVVRSPSRTNSGARIRRLAITSSQWRQRVPRGVTRQAMTPARWGTW